MNTDSGMRAGLHYLIIRGNLNVWLKLFVTKQKNTRFAFLLNTLYKNIQNEIGQKDKNIALLRFANL